MDCRCAASPSDSGTKPPGGNQPNSTAGKRISMSPSQNPGTDTPMTAKMRAAWSIQVPS